MKIFIRFQTCFTGLESGEKSGHSREHIFLSLISRSVQAARWKGALSWTITKPSFNEIVTQMRGTILSLWHAMFLEAHSLFHYKQIPSSLPENISKRSIQFAFKVCYRQMWHTRSHQLRVFGSNLVSHRGDDFLRIQITFSNMLRKEYNPSSSFPVQRPFHSYLCARRPGSKSHCKAFDGFLERM